MEKRALPAFEYSNYLTMCKKEKKLLIDRQVRQTNNSEIL